MRTHIGVCREMMCLDKWSAENWKNSLIFVSINKHLVQWRSQGLPGWATRPPGEPK